MAAKTPFFTNNANLRFDKLDTALALNRRQLLFVETWFNEVHEFSVDAFRVRAMNSGEPYQFAHALAWMFNRLASHHKQYRITFPVNQLSNADAIPRTVGDIEFRLQLAPASSEARHARGGAHRTSARCGPLRFFEAELHTIGLLPCRKGGRPSHFASDP